MRKQGHRESEEEEAGDMSESNSVVKEEASNSKV
jgi:hypothetical protein